MSRADGNEIKCGKCEQSVMPAIRDLFINDVYYPRCEWTCPRCGHVIDDITEDRAKEKFQLDIPWDIEGPE